MPNGFPRYTDNPSLSDTVNKYFRSKSLAETKEHTMYSFRHNFEDRLLAAEVDKRIRSDLMRHALARERDGDGASLELKARATQAIAI